MLLGRFPQMSWPGSVRLCIVCGTSFSRERVDMCNNVRFLQRVACLFSSCQENERLKQEVLSLKDYRSCIPCKGKGNCTTDNNTNLIGLMFVCFQKNSVQHYMSGFEKTQEEFGIIFIATAFSFCVRNIPAGKARKRKAAPGNAGRGSPGSQPKAFLRC